MSEVQIRQIRTTNPNDWLRMSNQLDRNFTSGWGAPINKYPEWQYESVDSNFFTLGEFAFSYSPDGYNLRLFLDDKQKSVKTLNDALDNNWLDHQTRAVFIEFIMYENAHRLFSSVQLTAEIPPIGNIFTGRTTVRSFRQHYIMNAQDVIGTI